MMILYLSLTEVAVKEEKMKLLLALMILMVLSQNFGYFWLEQRFDQQSVSALLTEGNCQLVVVQYLEQLDPRVLVEWTLLDLVRLSNDSRTQERETERIRPPGFRCSYCAC